MTVTIIDGQGGRIGRQLVAAVKKALPEVTVLAAGTNTAATEAMLSAGADRAATGENAVKVCASRADVLAGPIGIVIADALLGEVTPEMAVAIGQCTAKKVLIPVNLCDHYIAGVPEQPVGQLIQAAVERIRALLL